MNNPKFMGASRAYYRYSKSWYAQVGKIEVQVGVYCEDGGTFGEFCFDWTMVGRKLSPRLKAFDDSWAAMAEFHDLFEEMAKIDGQDVSEDDFCKILDGLGIEDWTKYEKE